MAQPSKIARGGEMREQIGSRHRFSTHSLCTSAAQWTKPFIQLYFFSVVKSRRERSFTLQNNWGYTRHVEEDSFCFLLWRRWRSGVGSEVTIPKIPRESFVRIG